MDAKEYTLFELYKEGIETAHTIKTQSELWLGNNIPDSTRCFLEAIIETCKTYLEKCKK